MSKILLAIGNTDYSKIIRNNLSEKSDFTVLEQEVMHHRYLLEIVDLEKPDILIVHDYYLPTDMISKEDREEEWLTFIQTLRESYDDSIRVVFLCERKKGEPFLSYLVDSNVLDIFNDNSIDIVQMIEQLKDKPRFSRVSKFKTSTKRVNAPSDNESEEEDEEPEEGTEPQDKEEVAATKDKQQRKAEKAPKPVVNKVVEKKVNVVNKQVVKKDYNIQVLNQVEKVVGVPVEKKLIMIGGPFSRSGSTFISHLLARELAKIGVSVTYVESPYSPAYSYDRFIGHELNPDYRSKFYQFTKEIDPKKPSVFDWTLEDINMVVKHPENEPIYDLKEIPFDVFIKILLASQSTVTIVDVGTDWHREIYKDIFDIATNAFFVIEPDLSNIQFLEDPDNKQTNVYRELIQQDKSSLIGNRFDKSLLKNEIIQDLYKDKFLGLVPDFPSNEVFDCQYKGGFINDHSKYKEMANNALQPIITELLPKEFLKKYSKQNSFFKGIFNKKITVNKA
ncbi:hypothetical protein NC797_07230 [Aquibacillus sp. 3ASR75-11]|uniref:Uncharacterized protein n=1 Tax=Terrihalobacillus insolitus TaxID=2950438 RepID=A0A9X4AN95_9BACI|nr:hypothetical protein [Terrihalobacillus insolitus]MDC3424300.1 hypothetical protein [Terrihalobacillus insolitus]